MNHSRSKRAPAWRVGTCLAVVLLLAWTAPAAAQGYREAVEALGQGDYVRALLLLDPLAQDGDPNAQFTLGFLHDYGQGVQADPATAAYWYGQAAAQDLPVAQFTLAGMYETGRGVPLDKVRAYRWYDRAADNLSPGETRESVLRSREAIAESLSPEELARAQAPGEDPLPELPGRAGTAPEAEQPVEMEEPAPPAETPPAETPLVVAPEPAEDAAGEAAPAPVFHDQPDSPEPDSREPDSPEPDRPASEEPAAQAEVPAPEPVAEPMPLGEPAEPAGHDEPAEIVRPEPAPSLAPEPEPEPLPELAPEPAPELAAEPEPLPAPVPEIIPEPEPPRPTAPTETEPPAASATPTQPAAPPAAAESQSSEAAPEVAEPPPAPAEEPDAAPSAEAAAVAEAQALLAGLGYDPGPADGVMGRRTREALAAFRADRGLEPAEGVDEALLSTLRAASRPDPAPAGPAPPVMTPFAQETLGILELRQGLLREIGREMEDASAAAAGWQRLESWEIETRRLLGARLGADALNAFEAARTQATVAGDPVGNVRRLIEGYDALLTDLVEAVNADPAAYASAP